MKLYNTRSQSIEVFSPLVQNEVRIYSCGPTVYDHAHIGNLSAYIFADTLRRTLLLAGYKVRHAMNYTDVDDKTIHRSQERYREDDPKIALQKLTDHYITVFLDDMYSVGNDIAALIFLRATDANVIRGMQELIRNLFADGFAYLADDGVYFSIDTYRKSGKTYGQLLKLTLANTSESRIQNDEYDKESVYDFALWKKQKTGEPSWKFTLDNQDISGRPGWHIECSVMSQQLLGQPFDIHTGGIDLIFPHHENEIAQSTAGAANPLLAQFFIHNEHVLVDAKKMSKSAKNFFTLKDILDRDYDPLAFRLLILQAHYRSQVHFSWDNLNAAQNRLNRFRNFAVLRYQLAPERIGSHNQEITAIQDKALLPALFDDLDTPKALLAIEQFMDSTEKIGLAANQSVFDDFLCTIDQAFGLQLMQIPDIPDAVKTLIALREAARKKKNWEESDRLRQQLHEQAIGIRDTSDGPVWYRL